MIECLCSTIRFAFFKTLNPVFWFEKNSVREGIDHIICKEESNLTFYPKSK